MLPAELPEWVKEKINKHYNNMLLLIYHWWEENGVYFVIGIRGLTVYCLKITQDRLEESNILYLE